MFFFVTVCVFFFKQKTAYELRISDWSSDVCSSDLTGAGAGRHIVPQRLVWSALRASSGLRARTAPRLFQRPMVDGRRAIADGALSCRTRLRARSVGDRHHRAMPARILAAGVGSARDLPDRKSTRLNSSP